ncbi:MAG: 4Fe-4S dicluster domain-containing protein [Massiliimalia sp.]
MANLKPEDIKRVKGMGFLKNTTNEGFSMRVLTKNGVLNANQFRNLCDVAEQYGDGTIAMTTRLTVELPGIKYEDIDTVREYIAKEGMVSGGTGSRVRPVVACKGTVCQYGNCDTQGIAEKIHDRFFVEYYDVKLPHKFKIAVGGCPNNCVKPDLNDFGIVGVTVPNYDADLCSGCKKCGIQAVCPMGAITRNEDGVMEINPEVCNNCGRCVGKCYFDALDDGKKGFVVYIGGRWGKKVRRGSRVPGVFQEDEVMKMIEKTLLLFREKGITGERLSDMLDRMGEDAFFAEILSDDILARKQEILDANLHVTGGATC